MRNIGTYVGWHCVRIEHIRLVLAVDLTFRHMLVAEYRDLGQPDNCRVYRHTHQDGSYSYYFSPGAVHELKAFLNFWQAFGVAEPVDLEQMDPVI